MKVVIIGAGEVGYYFAEWLAYEGKEVVVIDKNPDALARILEHLDVQTYHGSGSNPKVLADAGVHSADILLAVTDSDEVNLIACFFANLLAPGSIRWPSSATPISPTIRTPWPPNSPISTW